MWKSLQVGGKGLTSEEEVRYAQKILLIQFRRDLNTEWTWDLLMIQSIVGSGKCRHLGRQGP